MKQGKANRVFPREYTGHSKHLLPTTQEKTLHMDITRWSTPKSDLLYSLQLKMEKLYIVSKNKTRADCDSDHELLIAKFRLKLKKLGNTTGPFKYDLDQIPYDYTVEVRNKFKGLDLLECQMNYGWRFVTCTGDRDQDHPRGKEMQKAKWLSGEALQITVKRREAKSKRE